MRLGYVLICVKIIFSFAGENTNATPLLSVSGELSSRKEEPVHKRKSAETSLVGGE